MAGESVVGVFDREALSSVLVRLHQQRLGTQVRVLDAARAPLATQVSRAGLSIEPGPEASALGTQAALVLISAPGRHNDVAKLLRELGAQSVTILRPIKRSPADWATSHGRATAPQPDPALLQPDAAAAESRTNS